MALGKNSAHSARLSAHAMQVSTESKHEEGETSDGPLGALFPTNTASQLRHSVTSYMHSSLAADAVALIRQYFLPRLFRH